MKVYLRDSVFHILHIKIYFVRENNEYSMREKDRFTLLRHQYCHLPLVRNCHKLIVLHMLYVLQYIL